jgi:2'-5' RNA ligase
VRLFAAVDLAAPVRHAAFAVGEGLARALAGPDARGRLRVSWVREENLHLTVRFLGEIEDGRVGDLGAAFCAPLATQAFDLELGGVGVFPPSGPPRVIWIGVRQGAERLAALSAEVDERFEALGFGRGDRPLRAHLTIARCKDAFDRQMRDRILGADPGAIGASRVQEVVLYESRLSARGPAYASLARAPLSAWGRLPED